MKILAIGAHPDDIEIGCGGALIKYARKKHEIYLLVLTKGEIGAAPHIRQKEQEIAARFLKARRIFWGGFQDTCIPTSKELINEIEKVLDKVKPDMVFCNYHDDIHQDHRAIASGSASATRYVKKVLSYEVPTTRNFQPDVFMDIADVLNDKLKLLKLHSSQVKKTRVPHLTILESAKSCANFRGYQARVKYAEGFKAMRFLMDVK